MTLTPLDLARRLLAPQPDPVHTAQSRSVTDWTVEHLTTDPVLLALHRERRVQGRERYRGLELRTFDGRHTVADAVQEGVDLQAYLVKYHLETGSPIALVHAHDLRHLLHWLASKGVP